MKYLIWIAIAAIVWWVWSKRKAAERRQQAALVPGFFQALDKPGAPFVRPGAGIVKPCKAERAAAQPRQVFCRHAPDGGIVVDDRG